MKSDFSDLINIYKELIAIITSTNVSVSLMASALKLHELHKFLLNMMILFSSILSFSEIKNIWQSLCLLI